MLFILDANVIAADPMLRSPAWDAAEDAVKDSRIRVLIPTFAIDEAIAVYHRNRNATAVQIRKLARHASKAVKNTLAEAIAQTTEEARSYAEILRDNLRKRGAEIVRAPTTPHDLIVDRAIQRVRPFDENGSGYRDTLHWFSVLDIVQDHYETNDIVFVSADAKAFGGTNPSGSAPELHEHLKRDLEEYDARTPYFRWVLQFRDAEIPDQYLSTVDPDLARRYSAAEIAGHVLTDLSSRESLDIDPKNLGLHQGIDVVLPLDLRDATLKQMLVRQYYAKHELNIEFVVEVEAELATQTVIENDSDAFIEESQLVVPLQITGFVDTEQHGELLGVVFVERIRPVRAEAAMAL